MARGNLLSLGTMAGIGAARQLAMDEGLCAAHQAEGASATL